MDIRIMVVRKNCGPSMLGLLTDNMILYKWFGSRIYGISKVDIVTKEALLGDKVEGKTCMVGVIGQA
jgi:hypothetical protein